MTMTTMMMLLCFLLVLPETTSRGGGKKTSVFFANAQKQQQNDDALWCEPENCYDLLELHQHNATKALIKKQYFKFSRLYHPDKIDTYTGAGERTMKKRAAIVILLTTRMQNSRNDEKR